MTTAGPDRRGERRRAVVLVNPSAGTGIRADLGALALRAGLDLDLRVVQAGSAAELRAAGERAVAEGVDALVVQGGDGMVHLGVGIVAGTEVPLGIVPLGTGNDFARTVGIPTSPGALPEQLERLLRALAHPDAFTSAVDAIRVRCEGRETWVANSVNFGFDALVNERANELRHVPGRWRYLAAIAQVSSRFRAREFRMRLDGGPVRAEATTLVSVLNGRSMGGGLRVAPEADVADGALDLFTVADLPRAGFVALFPSVFVGLHTRLPQVRLRRVTRVEVRGPADVPVYADGERLGAGGFDAHVVPGAWRLLRG